MTFYPPILTRISQIIDETGYLGLWRRSVAFAYQRAVRPLLPRVARVRYAGIPVALEHKWGDDFFPKAWKPEEVQDKPEYEASLLEALRQHVNPADRVVVVGGGVGVSVAMAARLVGPTGSVHCYEAARRSARRVRRTAALNGVGVRVTVHHAVVARPIAVYGRQVSRRLIAPDQLPDCDVLELDCEGAEVEILQQMTIRPRIAIVETHGMFGAPTHVVLEILEDLGYSAEVVGLAEPQLADVCEVNDIRVIAARLRGSMGNTKDEP